MLWWDLIGDESEILSEIKFALFLFFAERKVASVSQLSWELEHLLDSQSIVSL